MQSEQAVSKGIDAINITWTAKIKLSRHARFKSLLLELEKKISFTSSKACLVGTKKDIHLAWD
jgi:hypothetical protein